ncbi:MAG: 30S ribosomal protein S9 [Deltaproteobacteria bacterium]|nr:30S ribosomal protein S9 [Deltaproteobacteria bacterium]
MAAKVKAITAIGRRKNANARVFCLRSESKDGKILVNGRELTNYFPRKTAQQVIMQPIELTERVGAYDFRINVQGGGLSGQAGAVRHGISRALEKSEPELRSILKKNGFLTRDPRVVERKKPGRHKARKKTQFSKR